MVILEDILIIILINILVDILMNILVNILINYFNEYFGILVVMKPIIYFNYDYPNCIIIKI